MNRFKQTGLFFMLTLTILALSACVAALPPEATGETAAEESMTDAGAAYAGPVTEIAIRRVNDGQDPAAFAAARDAFVAALTAEPGVGTDREFAAILDGAIFAPPEATVFTGMTQYENLAAFAAAGEKLGSSPEAAAFFSTFEPQLFTALRPKNPAAGYDLAAILPEPGQILEVAARDLSMVENFDSADYETRLDAFLDALSQQPGFVAEYQWVSVLDPNIVVGMTVYESIEALAAIAQDQEFVAQMMPFAGSYPTFVSYFHTDARLTAVPGEMSDGPIYEVAINQVKPGRLAEFTEARAAFITEMKMAEGVGPDAAFQSFFTMPGENESEVFVGVTEWNSSEDFANAAAQLMPTEAFQNYTETFDQLAYLQVRPEDGEPFDLQQMMESGAVEFAVRTIKPGQESLFVDKRKAFFDAVAAQPGYLFDRELLSIDGDSRILIVAWESAEDFQNALSILAEMPEMGDFLSLLDVQTYQVTQKVDE